MDEEKIKKAIQQARANVELETTPINEIIIKEVLNMQLDKNKEHKTLIKRGNTNGRK